MRLAQLQSKPAEVATRDVAGVGYDTALQLLYSGYRVARRCWSADDSVFLYYVPASKFVVNRPPLLGIFPSGTEVMYEPHIDICNNMVCSTWSPSMLDTLAVDWYVV